jgi:hypothetical protein
MIRVSAEFVLEGPGLDFDEVTRLVGAKPVRARRGAVDLETTITGGVDRWVLAARAEWPDGDRFSGADDIDPLVGELRDALRGRVEAIASYCEASGVKASFRISVDADRPAAPMMVELPPEFCGWMALLGASVEFDVRTRPVLVATAGAD